MKLSESEINDVIMIQKRLMAKIEAHQKEIKILEQNWKILDGVIAESSFTNASELLQEPNSAVEDMPNDNATTVATTHEEEKEKDQTTTITIPIRDSNNTNEIIANAYRTQDYINIVISEQVSPNLTVNVEPFDSFFLKKILYQMKNSDQEEIQNGTMTPQAAIDYDVETDQNTSRIKNIVIRNYNDEKRATEIISTIGWTLARMLENINRGGGGG